MHCNDCGLAKRESHCHCNQEGSEDNVQDSALSLFKPDAFKFLVRHDSLLTRLPILARSAISANTFFAYLLAGKMLSGPSDEVPDEGVHAETEPSRGQAQTYFLPRGSSDCSMTIEVSLASLRGQTVSRRPLLNTFIITTAARRLLGPSPISLAISRGLPGFQRTAARSLS
jgi:hypothetical protein